MSPAAENKDDSLEKDAGWFTAFYNYAEYLRLYTKGAVNHKTLYGLVGSHGNTVAHENALIRKRTAGNLSKLLHSSRYAADIASAYEADSGLFDRASLMLLQEILTATSKDAAQLSDDLLEQAWPEIRRGLLSEVAAGRTGISSARMDGEIALIKSWAETMCGAGESSICAKAILCSFFWLLTYGHIQDVFANSLVDGTPTNLLDAPSAPGNTKPGACLMRMVGEGSSAIENVWTLSGEAPFEIGRYMTCDAIEVEGCVSRRHCKIYFDQGIWYLEDECSRYGTQIVRGDCVVWESLKEASNLRCALHFGDTILIAQKIPYWFVELQNNQGTALN